MTYVDQKHERRAHRRRFARLRSWRRHTRTRDLVRTVVTLAFAAVVAVVVVVYLV